MFNRSLLDFVSVLGDSLKVVLYGHQPESLRNDIVSFESVVSLNEKTARFLEQIRL